MPQPDTFGVLYAAFGGGKHLKYAITSAKSLKRNSPGVPCCLFTDVPQAKLPAGLFDQVISAKKQAKPPLKMLDRLLCFAKTPFERTLALDADTYICAKLQGVFKVLDQFDVAMCHGHNRVLKLERQEREGQKTPGVPSAFATLNGGLVLYHAGREHVQSYVRQLADRYRKRNYWSDQATTRDVLWERTDIRLYILGREWNFNDLEHLRHWKRRGWIEAKPRIFHNTRHKDADVQKLLRKEGLDV